MRLTFLTSFFIIISFLSASAQFTETINTNRPGNSQGAYGVGKNIFQLEGGLAFQKEKHSIFENETSATHIEYNFRFGLIKEQLEFNIAGLYRTSTTEELIANTNADIKRSGFPFNTIGVKYLFYDPYKFKKQEFRRTVWGYVPVKSNNLKSWNANNGFNWKRLIPAVSAYVGFNFSNSSSDFAPHNNPDTRITSVQKSLSPKVVISAQNNWSKEWVFVANLVFDQIGSEVFDKRIILTSTYNLNDQWSFFGEYEGASSPIYKDFIFRAGTTYAITQDFQLDALVSKNIKDTPNIFNFGIGASYRLNFRQNGDDEKIDSPEYREVKKVVKQIKKDIEKGILTEDALTGKYKGYDLEDFSDEEIVDGDFDFGDTEVDPEYELSQTKWWQFGKKKKLRQKIHSDSTKAILGTDTRITDFADKEYIEEKQKEITPGERTAEELLLLEQQRESQKKRGAFGWLKGKKKKKEPRIDSSGDTIPEPDYTGMSKKEIRKAKKEEEALRKMDEEISRLEKEILGDLSETEEQKAVEKRQKNKKKRRKKELAKDLGYEVEPTKPDDTFDVEDAIEEPRKKKEKRKKKKKKKKRKKKKEEDIDIDELLKG